MAYPVPKPYAPAPVYIGQGLEFPDIGALREQKTRNALLQKKLEAYPQQLENELALHELQKKRIENQNAKITFETIKNIASVAPRLTAQNAPYFKQQAISAGIPETILSGIDTDLKSWQEGMKMFAPGGQALKEFEVYRSLHPEDPVVTVEDVIADMKDPEMAQFYPGYEKPKAPYQPKSEAEWKDIERMKSIERQAETAKDSFDREKKLRDSYRTDTKNIAKVSEQYSTIKRMAELKTGIGDIGVIRGILLMFEPNSVVRESEFASAEAAAGVFQRAKVLFEKWKEGDRLTEGARAQFMDAANQVWGSASQRFNTYKQHYQGLANRYGLNPENIMVPYETQSEPEGPERIPKAAMDQLKEGIGTRFKNGQVWMLKDGKAHRVE